MIFSKGNIVAFGLIGGTLASLPYLDEEVRNFFYGPFFFLFDKQTNIVQIIFYLILSFNLSIFSVPI